jgi:hypothetical protein
MHAADGADDRRRHDQLSRKSLMIPFTMVVRDELCDVSPEVRLANRNDPIQTLLFDRRHEPLGVGMGIRTTSRLISSSTPRRRGRLGYVHFRTIWLPMPSQQRVGRSDRGNLTQSLTAQPKRLGGEPPSVIIGEPQPPQRRFSSIRRRSPPLEAFERAGQDDQPHLEG